MPNRHLSRTIAMQTLYEWDFQKNLKVDDIISRNEKFFENEDVDKKYISSVVQGVVNKIKDIDGKIQDAAKQWPLEQIPILDKTLLRLSCFELFYLDEIPAKVAINEAVELGKSFGSENTSKFINGVLGTLYKIKFKDIGKEIEAQWKILQEKIRKSQKVKKQISAGGVVYNRHIDKFLLIKDSYGRWALPKGKMEQEETPEQTAIREIGEETGLKNTSVVCKLGKIEYYFRLKNQAIFKTVHNFLLKTTEEKLTPDAKEIKDAVWLDKNEALKKIAYKNAKKILENALVAVEKEKQNNAQK